MSEKLTNEQRRAMALLLGIGMFPTAHQASVVADFLAAAEESGRRSQADLLLECEEALIWCSAADAFKPDGIAAQGWLRVVLPVLERVRIARKSLAPRDSALVCDAVVSSDPFREWRCGKQKGHEGPHSGEAPRDSGKEG